jgi:hypothetical protein
MSLLTKDRVKALCGIAECNTTYDLQFQALIPSIVKVIENYCRIVIDPIAVTEYHSGDNDVSLFLRTLPVIAVATVEKNAAGAWGSGPDTWAELEDGTEWALVDEWGELRRLTGLWDAPISQPWTAQGPPLSISPRDTLPTGNYRVVYSAGMSAFPDDLALVASMLIQQAMKALEEGGGGVGYRSESDEGYSYSLGDVITDLPPLAKRILGSYRRIPVV